MASKYEKYDTYENGFLVKPNEYPAPRYVPAGKNNSLKIVHFYDPITRKYLGDRILDWTDRDPLTYEWMIPANATEAELPGSVKENEEIIYRDNQFVAVKKEAEVPPKEVARNVKDSLATTKINEAGVETLVVPGGEIWVA